MSIALNSTYPFPDEIPFVDTAPESQLKPGTFVALFPLTSSPTS